MTSVNYNQGVSESQFAAEVGTAQKKPEPAQGNIPTQF